MLGIAPEKTKRDAALMAPSTKLTVERDTGQFTPAPLVRQAPHAQRASGGR